MPNNCYNKIQITGDALQKFRESMNQKDAYDKFQDFSFHHMVPAPSDNPEYHEGDITKMTDKSFYNWNRTNWGTKWDAYDIEIEDNDDVITIICTTAWSPPIEWARNVNKQFDKNLEIMMYYHEEGLQFYGDYYTSKECDEQVEYPLKDGKDWKYNEEKEEYEYLGVYREFLEEHFSNVLN